MRVKLKIPDNLLKANAPSPPPTPAHVIAAAETAKAKAAAAAQADKDAKYHLYGLLLQAQCKGNVPEDLARSKNIGATTPPDAGLLTKHGLLSSVKPD